MTATGELRQLISLATRFDAARRRAPWHDDIAFTAIVDEAHDTVELTTDTANGAFASARSARIATAQAILDMVAQPVPDEDATNTPSGPGPELRAIVLRIGAGARSAPRRIGGELRHIIVDKPHSILLRLVITLCISIGLVAFYEFSGWSNYTASQLMLYFYSAVVGSVVCTNALCFEAGRTRALLRAGEPVWRILVIKNITMMLVMLVTGVPAILLLVLGPSHLNVVALIDQFLVMLFVWLGIANVLSVLSPLRQEPLSARLKDGTWLAYLASFGVSYGVGLTVNLMIFWRLWARQAASEHITGGAFTAFAMVLASSMLLWLLLTVFAAACAENLDLRRALDREMLVYRKG